LAAAVMAVLPSLAAAKDAVVIEAVKVETKTSLTGKSKGNEYLRVSFDATVNDPAPKTFLRLKGKATVEDKTRVDDALASGKLESIEPGTTKAMSAALFITEGLGGSPSKCQLTFMVVKILDKSGPTVAEYCWTGGSKAKPGACE
jgi:hypothetical protein